jgi:hypothetical protein
MALFATGVRNDWDLFRDIALGAFLTIVPRIVAKFIEKRQAKLHLPAAITRYYSSDFSAW